MFVLVWRHVTFKLRVFHLWQTHFASYEELTVSPVRGLFYIYIIVQHSTISGLICTIVICFRMLMQSSFYL